jgi:hypothetical protein
MQEPVPKPLGRESPEWTRQRQGSLSLRVGDTFIARDACVTTLCRVLPRSILYRSGRGPGEDVVGVQGRAVKAPHTPNTFSTSSPKWLITLTAIRPVVGRGNGRETSE